jgi:hypothetical protein
MHDHGPAAAVADRSPPSLDLLLAERQLRAAERAHGGVLNIVSHHQVTFLRRQRHSHRLNDIMTLSHDIGVLGRLHCCDRDSTCDRSMRAVLRFRAGSSPRFGSQHNAQKDCGRGVLPFTKTNFMCRLQKRSRTRCNVEGGCRMVGSLR